MDLWNSGEFRAGLGAGAVAVVVVLVAAGIARLVRRDGRPLPLAGLALAAAALWAIGRDTPVTGEIVGAVAGVAVALTLGGLRWLPAPVGAVAALPFAWVIGFESGVTMPGWAKLAVLLTASAGAAAAAASDKAWDEAAPGPLLLAVSVAGVYLTVPDTEQAAALLGAALPLGLVGWPLRLARLGPAGAGAAVATLAWVSATGAQGRPASILGAVACLGLLAAEPVARVVRSRRRDDRETETPRRSGRTVVLLLGGHGLVVVVASRLAGPRESVPAAAALAALAGVAALVVAARVAPRDPARSP